MNAGEIVSLGKALDKASSAGEPASNVIDILKKLRNGVKPTEELLRTTKIGIHVNKQKKHPDRTVGKLASEIVIAWRNAVKPNEKRPATSPPKTNGAKSPENGSEGKITVALADRSAENDKVNTNRTGVKGRDKAIRLLYDALAPTSPEVPSIIIKHAIDVERALCNFCGPESQAYKDKIRSLFQNLRQKGNPTLRQRVISGDITPEQFVRMKADELKSPERRAEDAALQRTNMNEAMVAKAEQSISNALECGKCKQKKVSYTQAQTRSADEPMTTFCHCTVCGNMWKFS